MLRRRKVAVIYFSGCFRSRSAVSISIF